MRSVILAVLISLAGVLRDRQEPFLDIDYTRIIVILLIKSPYFQIILSRYQNHFMHKSGSMNFTEVLVF